MFRPNTSVLRDCRAWGGTKHLVLSVLCTLLLAWAGSAGASQSAKGFRVARGLKGTCVVSDWSPFTPCTRTGVDQWAHSRSRSVLEAAADCPALSETQSCEISKPGEPTDAATAAQQALTGLMVSLPLAVSVGISNPQGSANRSSPITITPELAASMAAGRSLWQQQASHTDLLHCAGFNGPVELLQNAGSPIVGGTSTPMVTEAQLAAASAALKAAAKAVAMQTKAAARAGSKLSGSSRMQPFMKALQGVMHQNAAAAGGGGVLPPPAADTTADITWSAGPSMAVLTTPGPNMTPDAAHTAAAALRDSMSNMVPWITLQESLATKGRLAAAGLHLNMTYDHSLQSATFNSADSPARATPALGQLLLVIEHSLTGIYGLNLSSTSAKQHLMSLPTTSAVASTNAGGGVSQLAVSLAGAWTQANLSLALGLQQPAGQQQQQQGDQASFAIQEPAILFSAAPSALYVAVQTNVPSLGVQDAPATINLRPGGAAALTLFEPCQPVSGLQLSDVQLHIQPTGDLTGVASGTLASTAVSALATVNPTASASARTPSVKADADQDLSLVMTAETVGAGQVADVITIITHRPPRQLLQSLRKQDEQQQRMQFSSVTLTYSSPRARRRRRAVRPRQDDAQDSGFNMVAVPDVNTAPALKQMLDAIGLSQDSLALRTGSTGSIGSTFAVASQEPFTLQLPAPFTSTGPAALSLEVGGKPARPAPADTLITTALTGAASAGLQLPGSSKTVSLDLSSVSVSTPTAMVGASGLIPSSAPVTAELAGMTLSEVSLDGFGFLQFGALNVSATAAFQPMQLQDLALSGPLTAFGVTGNANFSQSSSIVQQQGGSDVELSAYLPSVDLPMMARAMGVNMSYGVFSATLQQLRAHTSTAALKTAGAGPHGSQDATGTPLSVAAELKVLGMSSYVSFDLDAQQGTSFAASFVAGQINKVMMPDLLSSVTAALSASQKTIQAALRNGQASVNSLQDEAKEAYDKARQQAAAASAAFNTANQQAVLKLQQAALAAETATAAYTTARSQKGSALAQARNEVNAADMAFNQAKTLAYKNLNSAQQVYKEAIATHEATVATAQQRVDTLLAQSLQLRSEYNAANMLCTPTAQGLEQCKAAAAAWVKYQSASTALDTAQTALQEAATVGPSAQQLRTARDSFAAQQAHADDVISGKEWSELSAAAAKLQAASAALHEAEAGHAASEMQAANAALLHAQEASTAVLSPTGQQLKAVSDAKRELRAARASLKAATAAARLTPQELSAATQDLDSLLAALQVQLAALGQDASAAASSLVRFDRLSLGVNLIKDSVPVLLGVSFNGAVGSGDQQKVLSGSFQVDASESAEELGITISEVLRDSVLDAFKSLHRSLAAVL